MVTFLKCISLIDEKMHSEEDFLHGALSGKLPIILEINEQGLINMFVDAFIQGKSIKPSKKLCHIISI